jgi:hypothetical protein
MFNNSNKVIRSFACTLILFFSSLSANATLINDTVDAIMSSGHLDISQQFTTPSLVSAATEFTGEISFNSQLTADILLDVTDFGFSFTAVSTSSWGGHGGADALRIDLTDLDFTGGLQIVGINDLGAGHGLQSMGFTANSAFVIFNSLTFSGNNSRSFSFDTRPSQVPEPSTLAIFTLGMIGLASRRFKKQ